MFSQRLILFGIETVVKLIFAAAIDVAVQLLPSNSLVHLILVALCGLIMVSVLKSWELLVREVRENQVDR